MPMGNMFPVRLGTGSKRYLNRLLFDMDECLSLDKGNIEATLPSNDARVKHVQDILKLKAGDTVKIGILDVGINDNGMLANICDGNMTFDLGARKDLITYARPLVDLILAVPRPLRLERLLPIISSLGVGHLMLIDAEKVEKDYFGTLHYIKSIFCPL